jgi:hypothetical protein
MSLLYDREVEFVWSRGMLTSPWLRQSLRASAGERTAATISDRSALPHCPKTVLVMAATSSPVAPALRNQTIILFTTIRYSARSCGLRNQVRLNEAFRVPMTRKNTGTRKNRAAPDNHTRLDMPTDPKFARCVHVSSRPRPIADHIPAIAAVRYVGVMRMIFCRVDNRVPSAFPSRIRSL